MSQMPPPPGQPAPYGQPVPPGGYQIQPTQSNGWGIAALITGLVGFCVPFIGGLLALIFGAVGIKRSKTTHTGGALSIVGLILGILSLGTWALFGGGIFALIAGTKVNREAAKMFVTDIAAGNMSAAQGDTDNSMTNDELQVMIDTFKPHGTVTDVTCPVTTVTNGTAHVVGIVTFSDKTQQAFETEEVKPADKWKVSKFTLTGGTPISTPAPSTAPAP